MDKACADGIIAHEVRVARLAREAARETGKDHHAAFLAGLFHDTGKFKLPDELFSDREITKEEYELIKGHAIGGYLELKKRMLFTGLCSGMHHRMISGGGYGIDVRDIPREFSFPTIKKLFDISILVAIADYIDASMTRHRPKRLSEGTLEERLVKEYPDERMLVTIMLDIAYKGDLYKDSV